MSLLIFALIVIVVLALLLYAVRLLPIPNGGPLKPIIMVILVVIAALMIIDRVGLLDGEAAG